MKDVKIAKSGCTEAFKIKGSFIEDILRPAGYNVIETDAKHADYMICGPYDKTSQYLEFDGIRIMWSGENYVPDFNLVDYAMSVYPITYFDRHYRYPQCLSGYTGEKSDIESRHDCFNKDILKGKTRFANFIASHESIGNLRGDFYRELSKYKRIDAVGSYLNNMPKHETVHIEDGSKLAFQRTCKFSLCFESNEHEGFVTEKITDAFYAGTIPIYYGDPRVTEIFNPKAFINVRDYKDWESVIARIIYLDTHDEEYLDVLNEPVFCDKKYIEKFNNGLEAFLLNIFEQPKERAYRRSRAFWAKTYADYYKKTGIITRFCRDSLPGKIAFKAWLKLHKR